MLKYFFPKPTTLLIIMAVLVVTACESSLSQFKQQAALCAKAEQHGIMQTAYEACQQALQIVQQNKLSHDKEIISLFRLGRIKRKQGAFKESEADIARALKLSQAHHLTLKKAELLLEMSLNLAGQNRWRQGDVFLQQLLTIKSQLPDKQQRLLPKIEKQYAQRLKKTGS